MLTLFSRHPFRFIIEPVEDDLSDIDSHDQSHNKEDYILKLNVEIDGKGKRALQILPNEDYIEAANKFCKDNSLNEEGRKEVLKNVMKLLYCKRKSKIKVRLNSRQISELLKEFHSWENEVEAKVKVMLHKYDRPIINPNSKKILKNKLKGNSVYNRLYKTDKFSQSLYKRRL